MNVDEAMEEAWQFGEQESKDMLFAEHIAILLATEIERLRAELAAAKAASVCPVITIDCYTVNHEIYIACRSLQDCHKLSLWLRDRMKDKTPPQA